MKKISIILLTVIAAFTVTDSSGQLLDRLQKRLENKLEKKQSVNLTREKLTYTKVPTIAGIKKNNYGATIEIMYSKRLETPEYIEELKILLIKKVEILKAFSVDDNFNFSDTAPYQKVCDYLLFDTKGKDYGGNGVKFNWQVLNNYKGVTPFLLSS